MTGLVLLSNADDGRLEARARRGGGDGAADGRRGRARGGDARPRRREHGGGRRRRRERRARPPARSSPAAAQVALWDVDEARAREPRRELGCPVAPRREEALAADLLVTVTPGREVLLAEGALRPGQHVSLMGADGPGKAEIAAAELARVRVFCDDWEQASHGGELAHAVEAGLVDRDDVTAARRRARGRGAPDARPRDEIDRLRLDRPRDPGSRDRARRARAAGRARPAVDRALTGRPALRGNGHGSAWHGDRFTQHVIEGRGTPPRAAHGAQPNRAGSNSSSSRRALARDRVGDELAAGEAEDVAVTRVAGGDPDAVAAGHPPGERQHVRRRAPDPGPAVRHPRQRRRPARRRARRARAWIAAVVSSTSCHSASMLDVAEAAERRAARRAAAASSRSRGARSAAGRRGARRAARVDDHLPARRPDQLVELGQRARAVKPSVATTTSGPRRARRRRRHGSPSTISAPASAACAASRRTQRAGWIAPSPRVDDRAGEEPVERRRTLVDPLGREAVLAQRVVLGLGSPALLLVGGEPEAAAPPQRVRRRVARIRSSARSVQRQSRRARSRPMLSRASYVALGAAAEREAAVAPARAAGDLACLVHAHAEPALREAQRAGAARDAGADDDHVDRARRGASRAGAGSASSSQYGVVTTAAMLAGARHHLLYTPARPCDEPRQLELDRARARPRAASRPVAPGQLVRRRGAVPERARAPSRPPPPAAAAAGGSGARSRSPRARPRRRSAEPRRAGAARSSRPRAPT